jgi:RecJ-like exonuclease
MRHEREEVIACPDCKGSGSLNNENCNLCKGAGSVKVFFESLKETSGISLSESSGGTKSLDSFLSRRLTD